MCSTGTPARASHPRGDFFQVCGTVILDPRLLYRTQKLLNPETQIGLLLEGYILEKELHSCATFIKVGAALISHTPLLYISNIGTDLVYEKLML